MNDLIPERAPDLLQALEGLLRKAALPASVRGTVCLGVLQADEWVRWWTVVLGPTPRSRFSFEPPADSDAAVVLEAADAAALVTAGRLPEGARPWLRGNRQLLLSFCGALFAPLSPA